MNPCEVKNYFENPKVVEDYARAVEEVGLWNSEREVFGKYFAPSHALLELGCGAGRIAVNLAASGYENICATDFSQNMVDAAVQIAARKNLKNLKCFVCDATAINLQKESFDGVIFGFNGLMQIPLRENRRKAMRSVFSILKRGGIFIFTTHDRGVERNKPYWSAEQKQWQTGSQQPLLDEFGDVFYRGAHGNIFIHTPARDEIAEDIAAAGFELIEARARSEIASESDAAENFSDDCIFWVGRKNGML